MLIPFKSKKVTPRVGGKKIESLCSSTFCFMDKYLVGKRLSCSPSIKIMDAFFHDLTWTYSMVQAQWSKNVFQNEGKSLEASYGITKPKLITDFP